MIKCPRCNKRKAIIHEVYGVTFCKVCQNNENFDKPTRSVEFTTDSIQEGRREYRKDILQPFHSGVLSKEYVEEYGTTGIEVAKEQVKNAKYTYKGTKGWWSRKKGKGGSEGRKTEKLVKS